MTPVNLGVQNTAAPVHLGVQNFCGTSSPGGCRISAAPLNLVPQNSCDTSQSSGVQNFCGTSQSRVQNFCGTSQSRGAEFLQHQSISGRRISPAPVSLGVQNFCDSSKLCGVPFRIFSASGKRNKSKVSYVIQNLLGTNKFLFVSYILALFC